MVQSSLVILLYLPVYFIRAPPPSVTRGGGVLNNKQTEQTMDEERTMK